jgi:hypothetical protein
MVDKTKELFLRGIAQLTDSTTSRAVTTTSYARATPTGSTIDRADELI